MYGTIIRNKIPRIIIMKRHAFAQSLIKKLDKIEDIEIDQLEKDSIKFQFPWKRIVYELG